MISHMNAGELKVCVVGQHASMKFGGEASFPWICFRMLRERGIDATMVVHDRTRAELEQAFGEDFKRIHFASETWADRFLFKVGKWLPGDLDSLSLAVFRHYLLQRRQRKVIRKLIQTGQVNIIHESIPVSPKQISALHGLGVPLMIGPLCGGIEFPPAFRFRQGKSRLWAQKFSRSVSGLCNTLVPGKKKAQAILVANEQTRQALPSGYRAKIHMMPEISVDRSLWKDEVRPPRTDGKIKLVYLGRLVNWKAVDLLIEAFAQVTKQVENVSLEILGDGKERANLQQQAKDLGVADRIEFAGYVKPAVARQRLLGADIFVLPSLRECGGFVLLEAMALGLPVIGANWAGPGVHISDETGIRVAIDSHEAFVAGLTTAIVKLAQDPELRKQMGEAGKKRISVGDYDWEQKMDHLIQIYIETIGG